MTRTIWIVVTPRGTQASLSLLGTPSSSSCTRKPSAKPSTQPRQVASRWIRAGSLLPSLSMLEQISEKSRPDRLISGCSGVLFGPVLAGEPTKPVLAREQIKKSASSPETSSRRTAASNPLRDSTSDLRCCQQRETHRRKADATAIQRIEWFWLLQQPHSPLFRTHVRNLSSSFVTPSRRPPPRHFERSRPIFFFRFRSCESIGLRREKSLFLFALPAAPVANLLQVPVLTFPRWLV